jgi:hypothetical protein
MRFLTFFLWVLIKQRCLANTKSSGEMKFHCLLQIYKRVNPCEWHHPVSFDLIDLHPFVARFSAGKSRSSDEEIQTKYKTVEEFKGRDETLIKL